MNFIPLAILSSILILSACSSTETFRAENCNQEIGYEHGMNDGREAKPMDSSFFGRCEEAGRKEAMLGYREGYEAALKLEREKGINADESGIRVNVPGVKINLPNKANQAWVCETVAADKTYTAVGATKTAATRGVRAACEEELTAGKCGSSDVSCEKNI